jgi:hypothetical protein
MFMDIQNRVISMALIHETLYQSGNLRMVDFGVYVRTLAEQIFRSYNVVADRIALQIRADEVMLDTNQAIPCGLILNELLSNCLKHAFPSDREGEIHIELRSDAAQRVTIIVRDTSAKRDKKALTLDVARRWTVSNMATSIGAVSRGSNGSSRRLRAAVEPVLEFFRAIPPPVLVPLLAVGINTGLFLIAFRVLTERPLGWSDVAVFFFMYVISGFGVTVGRIVDRDDCHNGPEDLLTGDSHRVIDARVDRRRDEVAAQLVIGRLTARLRVIVGPLEILNRMFVGRLERAGLGVRQGLPEDLEAIHPGNVAAWLSLAESKPNQPLSGLVSSVHPEQNSVGAGYCMNANAVLLFSHALPSTGHLNDRQSDATLRLYQRVET